MRRITALGLLVVLAVFGATLARQSAAAPPGATVVISGLDNPRGLAVSGHGRGFKLYVAEAGEGGPGPCVATGDPGRPVACYGPTGAITLLHRGVYRRIVTGMPSNTQPGSRIDATGPHDISLHGGKLVTIGMGAPPANRPGFGPGGRDFAKVVRLTGNGWRPVADIAAYEAVADPDHGGPYTNPYGLLQSPSDRILTDAGGNSLLRFTPNGRVSTVAVFPSRSNSPRGTDSVPTSIVRGSDGYLYVGELSGVPFAPGAANIYRIVGGTPQVWQSGFTTIIDMAFACDGTLYVLQHSSAGPFFAGPGEVVRVERSGARSTAFTGLQRPASIVFGPNGELYISNRGNEPDVGEVLRVSVGERGCRAGGHDDDDDDDSDDDDD